MIEIEQYIYDMSEEGEVIILYKMLFENGTQAEICNLGATVLSVKSAEGHSTADTVQISGIESLSKQLRSKIWEARVEVNRVVMLTSAEGESLQLEAIFDLDEECNLEVTYHAVSTIDTTIEVVDGTHFNLAEGNEPALKSVSLNAEEIFSHNVLYRFEN